MPMTVVISQPAGQIQQLQVGAADKLQQSRPPTPLGVGLAGSLVFLAFYG